MTRKTQNTDKKKKPDKTATVADLEQREPFDPWTAAKATRQKVARAGADALESGREPEDDFYRLAVWAELCLLDEEFPDKRELSDLAVVQRLKQCFSEEITPPKWLTFEFLRRGTLTHTSSKRRNTRFMDGLKLYAAKKRDERNGIKRPLGEDSMTDFCEELGIEGIAGEPGSYGQKAYYTAKKHLDAVREYERHGVKILNKMLSGE